MGQVSLRGFPMLTNPAPRPPTKRTNSVERVVLTTIIALWIGTGLAGLGLLARSVLASSDVPKDLHSTAHTLQSEPSLEQSDASPAQIVAEQAPTPKGGLKPEFHEIAAAIETDVQPAIPAAQVVVLQPFLSPTTQVKDEPVVVENSPAPLPAPHTNLSENSPAPARSHSLEQASICSVSEQACIDLCPDGSAFDDGIDFGGTKEWDVCEQACAFGRIRCIKGVQEDPCGHFHGACRYHCYEESYGEECEDSCDQGRDTCAKILAQH